jgi:WD40 repeat protein
VLWEPASGRETTLATECGYPVRSLAFGPDGTFLATASRASAVRLWDPVTGQELGEPVYHPVMAAAVAVSPAGDRLATGGDDGSARIWAVARAARPAVPGPPPPRVRLRPAVTLAGHGGPVVCAAFTPDGRVVTGAYDGTVRLWDPATGAETGRLFRRGRGGGGGPWPEPPAPPGDDIPVWVLVGAPHTLAFSPDGRRLAAGCGTNGIVLFGLATGEEVGWLNVTGEDGPVAPDAVAFEGDGSHVLAVCADQTLRVWEAGTGAEVGRSPTDPFFGARSAAFSPDARTVAVTGLGRDTTVRLWDPFTGADLGRLVGHRGRAASVAVDAAGTRFATAGEDHTVRLWDLASGTQAGQLDVPGPDGGGPMAFSPSGDRLAVAVRESTARRFAVRLFDLVPA